MMRQGARRGSWLMALASVAGSLGLAGCGSEAPQGPPPRLKPLSTVSAPEVPGRTAGANPGRSAVIDDDDEAELSWRRDPALADPNPDDVFIIADAPRFEVIAPGPHPEDVFHVAIPERGQDSSTFVIQEPGTADVSGQPRAGFQLPAGFDAVAEAGYSPDGLPRRIICQADGAVMVLVPAGVSLLGTKYVAPEATPQFEVYLDDFYIDQTEVTLEQYARYLGERRMQVTRPLEEPVNPGAAQELPALGLRWGAARDYARWAGKELPTEAQWEKAARGPSGFEHPWGNGRTVFARARTLSQIDPVGSFPLDRSPYGVLDMAGNAREWCLDFYSEGAFAEAAASGESPLVNWSGPQRSAKSQRVTKGNGPGWNVWHREGLSMSAQRPDVGFRCVLVLKPTVGAGAQTEAAAADGAGAERGRAVGPPNRRGRGR